MRKGELSETLSIDLVLRHTAGWWLALHLRTEEAEPGGIHRAGFRCKAKPRGCGKITRFSIIFPGGLGMAAWLAPLLALVIAAGLCRRFLRRESRFHLLDHPNERSLHGSPVPRSGGVAMLAGMLAGWALVLVWVAPAPPWVLLAAGALLALVGFLDDLRDLSPLARLLVHLLAGAAVVWSGLTPAALTWPGGGWPLPFWVAGVFTLIFVVWLVNLYNFMDGMDGLAGSMALVGFATLGILGGLRDAPAFLLVNLVIAGAVAGFLYWNLPPARIFMGDTGSSLLGFLVAVLGLWGEAGGWVPLWATLLLFSPFLGDATYTLVRRMGRGERWWRPHRCHLYQRLVQGGWGHRRTLLAAWGLMGALAVSTLAAVLLLPATGQWTVLLLWVGGYVWLVVALERRLPRCRSKG
jgi:UDP-N-acetylmuramyl pentapeptide phosphotransferase/UDP-N-acetylglucosamine-1-phosphate transferase